MKKILVVESSPMGEQSVSRRLTKDILDELLKKHPDSEVTLRDLAKDPLPHVTLESLSASATPAEKRGARQVEAARASDQVVDELLAADIVVIGVPMWNFSLPSGFKAWIDHVARAGRTFAYTAGGVKGLAGGRKVFVATASGGVYSEGPGQAMDFVAPYLRAFLGFLGIEDVSFVRAEGISIPHLKGGAYEKARRTIAGVV